MIDEQTGYSNSPKFSVYRLNNNTTGYKGQTANEYHAVNELDNNSSLLTANQNPSIASPDKKQLEHKTPQSKRVVRKYKDEKLAGVSVTTPKSQKGAEYESKIFRKV